jgi:superfamily II DNA/RNA helicase
MKKVSKLQENLLQNKNHIVCNVKNAADQNKDSEQLHDSPIQHQYLICNKDNKFQNLVLYLKDFQEKNSGKIILFCHQRDTVHSLADSLKKESLLADALTGELGQVQRNSILRNFKSGNLKYLVATNIASRGIDIEKLAAVIHYDVPFTQEDYIHRSGRTGRSGFSLGTALTLCDSKTKSFYVKIMEELNLKPEEINLSRITSQKKSHPKTANRISFIKVHLNKGKQDKIRPGDILGALVQDLSFDKRRYWQYFYFYQFHPR